MTKKIYFPLLFAVFIFTYILPLAVRPLMISDETRYAEIPREMIKSGDWITPRLNGLRYFEKPVMGYWLTAASIKVFGENNFGVRFPSALSTGLVAVLIFFLCASCLGKQSILPRLATLIYMTTLGIAALGTFAVLDTPLSLFLCATLVTFFQATEEKPGSDREKKLLFIAGIFAGCAFLTKGFLAFVVPVLTAGPYLIIQKRWKDTLRMILLPVIGAILVSLPWALIIYLREPDFWHYFFWNEHVRRFLSNTAQHKEPFWFFIAILPAMFMPWTLFLPAAVIELWKKKWSGNSERRLFIFCLCWFTFPFIFFSASSGKLITYILPCIPPLTILLSLGLNHIVLSENKKVIPLGIIISILLVSLNLLILVWLYFFGSEQHQLFQTTRQWVLPATILATMLFLLFIAFQNKEKQVKIIFFALSFSLLFVTAHFSIPSLTLQMKAPGPLLLRNAHTITPEAYVLSGEEGTRAVSWYLKRDDVYLIGGAGELQYGLNYDDSQYRSLTLEDADKFIRRNRGRTILFVRQKVYKNWQNFLPEPVSVDTNGIAGYLFIHY